MIETAHMNGFASGYQAPATGRESVLNRLSDTTGPYSGTVGNFQDALAYAQEPVPQPEEKDDSYGFFDFLDVINPLQHLPIVSSFYREISGDEIKPASRIIGGTVFGGGIGAATSLVNVIVENETGKDIAGNVQSFVQQGRQQPLQQQPYRHPDHPEIHLMNALRDVEEGPHVDVPGEVIGFTDLGLGRREVHEAYPAADGRSAGHVVRSYTEVAPPNPVREPIAQVEILRLFESIK